MKYIIYLTGLIFKTNLTFPRFTYYNIVIPELMVESIHSNNLVFSGNSTSLARVIIPAFRHQLSCRYYNATDITIPEDTEFSKGAGSFQLVTQGEQCFTILPFHFDITPGLNDTVFGQVTTTSSCSHFLYAWGGLDRARTPPFQPVRSIGCNGTV